MFNVEGFKVFRIEIRILSCKFSLKKVTIWSLNIHFVLVLLNSLTNVKAKSINECKLTPSYCSDMFTDKLSIKLVKYFGQITCSLI